MIVIKRYQNRKLYDTSESCYVTLEEIETKICEGLQIQVIDNKTKKDITSKTLLQVIHNKEKQYNYSQDVLIKRIKSLD